MLFRKGKQLLFKQDEPTINKEMENKSARWWLWSDTETLQESRQVPSWYVFMRTAMRSGGYKPSVSLNMLGGHWVWMLKGSLHSSVLIFTAVWYLCLVRTQTEIVEHVQDCLQRDVILAIRWAHPCLAEERALRAISLYLILHSCLHVLTSIGISQKVCWGHLRSLCVWCGRISRIFFLKCFNVKVISVTPQLPHCHQGEGG